VGAKSFLSQLKFEAVDMICKRRWSFPPELSRSRRISDAISTISTRWPEACCPEIDPESPVFIFSAGWRSGSTLVQRLLFSSKEIAIWGEPIGEAAFIPRLAHSLGYITASWPPDTFFAKNVAFSNLQNKWIANLAPDIYYLHRAHRAFFLEWCKRSAVDRFGIDRWGIKEVRLTIDHARYLKWLFPKARFLFVYRNPFNAFRSWRGNNWRSVWPGYHSRSALAFARHWELLMNGFLVGGAEVNGLLIKFEDLISGEYDLNMLAKFVGVQNFDESVLFNKINDPHKVVIKDSISSIERMIISRICGKIMRDVGYV